MFNKIVIFFSFTVICVSSQCVNQECQLYLSRQYTRVKRGKYYSSPPLRFYNHPPMTIPIKGPFSFTPPPHLADDEPSYPGSRPYKVSKRPPIPPNDGLQNDDITNIVKHLSRQDLDKILQYAQEKDQSIKYKDVFKPNEYSRPYKKEGRVVNKGNYHSKYEHPETYTEEYKLNNFVTEPTPAYVKVFASEGKPIEIDTQYENGPIYRPGNFKIQTQANNDEKYMPEHYVTSQLSAGFLSPNKPQEFLTLPQIDNEKYTPNVPNQAQSFSANQNYINSPGAISFPEANNPYYTESYEEAKLPRPDNMREEDYEASNTDNVQKIVKEESNAYDVENFGDLPLMDYNSKLHDVSSYHVPHYTITQPKPSKPASISFPSSSSTLLKPSPAAAAIKEPVYEKAPPPSAAAEQSDAHLKAIKIWSHKSTGAAYTLHDDGSLTPERSRPKYG